MGKRVGGRRGGDSVGAPFPLLLPLALRCPRPWGCALLCQCPSTAPLTCSQPLPGPLFHRCCPPSDVPGAEAAANVTRFPSSLFPSFHCCRLPSDVPGSGSAHLCVQGHQQHRRAGVRHSEGVREAGAYVCVGQLREGGTGGLRQAGDWGGSGSVGLESPQLTCCNTRHNTPIF